MYVGTYDASSQETFEKRFRSKSLISDYAILTLLWSDPLGVHISTESTKTKFYKTRPYVWVSIG